MTAYERKLGGKYLPEARFRSLAETARGDWSRFDEQLILLPLEELGDGAWEGVLVDGTGSVLTLFYSLRRGLSFQPTTQYQRSAPGL